MRKLSLGALVVIMALLPAAVGTAEVSPAAIAYLQAQPPSPWITLALAAARVQPLATDHLRAVSGSAANDYAKTILAVAAAGENPATFGSIDSVAKLRSFAVGGQLGDPNFLNDDAWGILALSAAGVATTTPEIMAARDFLMAHQNSDGGFSFAAGGSSDTDTTAVAILALVEAGVAPTRPELAAAVSYLKTVQNADGGFPYQPRGESNANSTAWVLWAIRKLGQNPAAWTTEATADPLGFLATLQNPDGSFAWTRSVPGANLLATHDAVIALSGATMPVGYFRPPAATDAGYAFRLEGRDGTICDQRITGQTAYDLVVNGAGVCHYTFSGKIFEGLGFMLQQVNDVRAEGFAAWLYLVNHVPGKLGLQGYRLTSGDDILIYFDPDYRTLDYRDYDRPLALEIAPSVVSGQAVAATVRTFREGQWVALPGATIVGAGNAVTTDANGTARLQLADGVYQLAAERPGFIRSRRQRVVVGSGVPGSVGLQVEVVEPSPTPAPTPGGGGLGTVRGSSLVFTVTPSALDFGPLSPGQRATRTVELANGGSAGLAVAAQVFGEGLFASVRLDARPWASYAQALLPAQRATTSVELAVPDDYLGRGVKRGELIFWAEAR